MNRYTVGRLIGEGASGKVYDAIETATGKKVAIKQVKNTLNPKDREFAEKDAQIPKFLGCKHPNIICVHDIIYSGNDIFIVSDFVNGVPLDKYTADLVNKRPEFLNIIRQLADGLDYMHKRGIAHGDIKGDNILLEGTRPVYIDFDLSCATPKSQVKYKCPYDTAFGTPIYTAPEVWLKKPRDQRASDIYSLGLVFNELVTGKIGTPSNIKTIGDFGRYILDNPVKPTTKDPSLDRLIGAMIRVNPEKRPNAETVRKYIDDMIAKEQGVKPKEQIAKPKKQVTAQPNNSAVFEYLMNPYAEIGTNPDVSWVKKSRALSTVNQISKLYGINVDVENGKIIVNNPEAVSDSLIKSLLRGQAQYHNIDELNKFLNEVNSPFHIVNVGNEYKVTKIY